MATATNAKSAIVQGGTRRQVEVDVDLPSRREFLFYIWGASLVMLTGQAVAGLIWFALPRFREGEFGGVFRFSPDSVPPAGGAPVDEPAGRFWISHTEDNGLLALYAVCTHLGCLPKWQAINDRFECPCHGSKFERNGEYIGGPAPRGMDRFVATVSFTDGSVETTPADGGPIPMEGRQIEGIAIDTGNRITGPGR